MMINDKFGNYVTQKIIDKLIKQEEKNIQTHKNLKQKFIDYLLNIYNNNKDLLEKNDKPGKKQNTYAKHVHEYLILHGFIEKKEEKHEEVSEQPK